MITAALRAFTIAMWIVVLIALGAAAHQIAAAHADVSPPAQPGPFAVLHQSTPAVQPYRVCAMVGPTPICVWRH